MTHHNATFILASTDGVDLYLGISEGGERSTVTSFSTSEALSAFASLIRSEVLASIELDRPLLVVIGKNTTRATAGEKFLEDFALDIVRGTVAKQPAEILIGVAGKPTLYENSILFPRVASLPLPWATKSTPFVRRVLALLEGVAYGDEALDLLPKGRTYVGA